MKTIDRKYRESFRGSYCLIQAMMGYEHTETTVGHHLHGRLRDDIQIPLSFYFHTGSPEGIHELGKKTWYNKYISMEDCEEIAEAGYIYWKKTGENWFTTRGFIEYIRGNYEKKENKSIN